jgi:hypothetical protein
MMAEPIFIAVGGSGQHTMLAYLRLARLCNLPPARLITVDADLRQGNGSSATTAALIERQARLGFRDKVFWEPVRPLPALNDPQAQTFEALMRPVPGLETELFHSLFSPRQRDVKVTTGFHGHPAVASSTFRMFLGDGSNGLSKLHEWIALHEEQRIVVVGSTFGGTGSGVMPVLTSYIKEWCRAKGVKLRLGGVIQVRWFDLGLPDQTALEDSDKVDVTSHDLERNSSCLVEYYRKNLESLFDQAFLVGHHPHANRRSTGVEQQPEHPHAVNLLAGYVAYQLLHTKDLSEMKGLLGLVTPNGELEQHLQFPFGETRRLQPLARHIAATGAEIALHQAVLDVLAAGPPNAWDVIEPYPRFFPELVRQSQGTYGTPGNRVEPASSWHDLLDGQREALRWLAEVRAHSNDIGACQFSKDLVPAVGEIGRLTVHERQLPDSLHTVFHQVLRRISPVQFGDEPETVIRKSFYSVRQQLEGYLERRMRGTP